MLNLSVLLVIQVGIGVQEGSDVVRYISSIVMVVVLLE